VDDLIRSDKFNIEVLVEYLSRTADIINSKGYKEVYVAMLGDFIESFTGLNHANSWKGLGKGMFGMNAVILCSEILVESFLGKINNLAWVGAVSGNHCRTTSDKEGDQKGEVGAMLHYLLSKTLTVPVEYHPMILTKEVDGVYYVMTHGHLPISKRDPAKILFDYGKQGMFNVLLSGHTHSRKTTKTTRSTQMIWNEATVVAMDEVDYRVLVAPPMFTGNFFSESLGYSSSAGFLEIQSNGRGRINVFDYCL
jgi:predicted phosphodiesterase